MNPVAPRLSRLWAALGCAALLAGPFVPAAEAGRSGRPASETRSLGPAPAALTPVVAEFEAHGCATPQLTADEAGVARAALRRWADENPVMVARGVIRVAVHVMTSAGEGDVSDARIAEQIGVLNARYADSGYRFEVASIDRAEHPDWFRMTPGSEAEMECKRALAVEPSRHLNLYVCSPGPFLGWARYPWSAQEADASHGAVVHHATLPGGEGSLAQGGAAVHQVGHYLGLLHTFEGDCLGPGDEVEDTPCQAVLGSPDTPGNPMDGALHAHAAAFTAGQLARMRSAAGVFRPGLFHAPAIPAAGQSEIPPGLGAEPEDGRVLAYRGAFPNPFRSETALRFTLPSAQPVSLHIYSVAGQLVRTLLDATLPPGDHSAMFRAADLPSGAYFAVLKAGGTQMTRAVILVR